MLSHLMLSPNNCRSAREKMCWTSFQATLFSTKRIAGNSIPHRSKLNKLIIQQHLDKPKMLAVFRSFLSCLWSRLPEEIFRLRQIYGLIIEVIGFISNWTSSLPSYNVMKINGYSLFWTALSI